MYIEADLTIQGTELRSGVTSLTSNIPWIATLAKNASTAANVGDVALSLDITKLFESTIDRTGVAIKGFNNNKFISGPVVTSLVAGDSSVTLSGPRTAEGEYIGPVAISVNANKANDLLPTDTQLFNATMEAYGDLIAIGLPPNRSSSFVNAFHVPVSVAANSQLKFVIWVTGPQTFTVPSSLGLSTRVFTRPTLTTPSVTIPVESPIALGVPTGTISNAGKYIELSSVNITVSGGDTVYLRIYRAGTGDGVGSEIHILKNFAMFVV
jgi:hypothetical protein